MLNAQQTPKDYIVATNTNYSVREWISLAFKAAGFKTAVWEGEGIEEKLIIPETK